MNREEREVVRRHFAGIGYDIMFYSTMLGIIAFPALIVSLMGGVGLSIAVLCIVLSVLGFSYAKLIFWLIKRSRRKDVF